MTRTRGQAAADEIGARFVQLDVTDDASVAAARDAVEAAGRLDVLVNNAGYRRAASSPTLETDIAELTDIVETNRSAWARVTLAFLPLLERSSASGDRERVEQPRLARQHNRAGQPPERFTAAWTTRSRRRG